MSALLIAAAALALDWTLGEPRRFHLLVGFGRLAVYETADFFNQDDTNLFVTLRYQPDAL